MFDTSFIQGPNTAIEAVREFFATHGDDLADAARLMGGAAVEFRVINAAASLQIADRLDNCTRRDLRVLHRLLGTTLTAPSSTAGNARSTQTAAKILFASSTSSMPS